MPDVAPVLKLEMKRIASKEVRASGLAPKVRALIRKVALARSRMGWLHMRRATSYEYERPLHSRSNPKDFGLPDFTVRYEGDIFFWEHLGMLNVPSYREEWERKQRWYEANGFSEQLITSQDGADGGIDAK